MYRILLRFLLVACNVSRPSPTTTIFLTWDTGQYARVILFAVILYFKHIYMYMAVGLRANYFNTHSDLRFQLTCFVYLPRVCCMSPSGEILPVRFLTLMNGGDTHLSSLHRTVCPNGLATTTISTPVPVHARTELCILGSECSGVGHCPRSSVTETCALPRSLFTKCISGRVKFHWPERRDPISLSTNLVSHRVRGAWLGIPSSRLSLMYNLSTLLLSR